MSNLFYFDVLIIFTLFYKQKKQIWCVTLNVHRMAVGAQDLINVFIVKIISLEKLAFKIAPYFQGGYLLIVKT